ncbi:serine/threonine-protein kinase SBK1-like [Ambystoma mexicanum]|uniref:serine/threonine-protein kinase SBK1-like n=1 Tax=Ambystoma mexicanum TaxID=8296 RepID=UPI0037E99F90
MAIFELCKMFQDDEGGVVQHHWMLNQQEASGEKPSAPTPPPTSPEHKREGAIAGPGIISSDGIKSGGRCEEKNCTMNSSATETELILQDQVSQMSRGLVEVVLEDYFEVLEALGAGAYGSVLRAQNRGTDKAMALKLLKKSLTSLSGFLVEYCTSFLLSSHPSIIGCYEIAFQTPEHYVFAQELSLVGDLFSLIEDQVGIPEEKVKRCAVQISSALDFMHKKGYVHRDIKPEYVLLMDRECHRIKVTDFGFTRLKGTAISAWSGTISYMSPELYQPDTGCLEAEASLDVWAFGVLLFCVLTGTFPWEMAALSDINYNAFVEWITGGVDAIPSRWNRFTVEALKMFSKLLAHNPTQRSRAVEVLHLIDLPWTVDLYLTDGIEEINSTEEEYSTEPSASDSMSSCSDGSQAESSSPSSTSSTSCSHSESHEEAGNNKSISLSFLMSSSSGGTYSTAEGACVDGFEMLMPGLWGGHTAGHMNLLTDGSSLFLGAEEEVS